MTNHDQLVYFVAYGRFLLLYCLNPFRVLEKTEGKGVEDRVYFVYDGYPDEDVRFERCDPVG